MNSKTEITMSILAAMLVLLIAMVDPRISIVLAIILIIAYIIHQFFRSPCR